MDVLVYSALNEQAALKKTVREMEHCLFCLTDKCAPPTPPPSAITPASCWLAQEKDMWMNVCWCCWTLIDTGAYNNNTWTGEINVCDATGYYRCGCSCNWTVPSGVTKARFQLWGAGGGANKPPCCCGHTYFGNTGAYMSVIIPVTAGHTYTLCAGCAYCCYAYSTSGAQRMSGCPSYVQGCHFCNFCVDGGRGSYATWNGDIGSYCACRFSGYAQPGYGFYICNTGGDLCHNSQNMCCHIKYASGAGYHGAITDIDNPTEENVVYGIRGLWPCLCNDSNNYGWECHAPIYCFHDNSRCNPSWSSGNCCGCQCSAWTSGYLRYPGAGGFYSHAMGGGNGLYGDSGRFGMVRVSYC